MKNFETAHKNALSIFTRLSRQYPDLEIFKIENPGQCNLQFEIPKVLDSKIILTLQDDDELHLYYNKADFIWFPFDRSDQAVDAMTNVVALIEGQARIVERFKGSTYWKALLQIKENGVWRNAKEHSVLGMGWMFWLKDTQKFNRKV